MPSKATCLGVVDSDAVLFRQLNSLLTVHRVHITVYSMSVADLSWTAFIVEMIELLIY